MRLHKHTEGGPAGQKGRHHGMHACNSPSAYSRSSSGLLNRHGVQFKAAAMTGQVGGQSRAGRWRGAGFGEGFGAWAAPREHAI